ncbi:MAG TPA: alpha/beta hydrolase [Geodermatophilus sp.]|nr:alpha/beta hydrolase [Geodermatophilus sp.]
MSGPSPAPWHVDGLVDAGGQRLYVLRRLGTGPTVVLCSALGLVCSDWAAVCALLPGVDVVTYDRPGNGYSPSPDPAWPDRRPATLDEEAARLAAVGPAVAAGPPYVLVGHSSGGLYAQAFARMHPQLTAGVVLVDASSARALPDQTLAAVRHRLRTALFRSGLAQLFGPSGRRLMVWAQSLRGADPLAGSERRHIYGGDGVRGVLAELDGFAAAAARLAELERTGPLPGVPTTVVTAASTGRPLRRRDRSWIAEQERLVRTVGAGRWRVVDDAAHLLPLDRPGVVAEEIRRLLHEVQDQRPRRTPGNRAR